MRRFLFGIAAVLALTGCKGEKWGDKFKGFVENDVAALSADYARSQFTKKWSNAFRDQMIFANEQLLQTADVAIGFTFKTTPDTVGDLPEPELVGLYIAQLNAATVLNEIEALVVSAQTGLRQAGTICDDREAFFLLDLNNEVLRGMFAMTKPEENETYYVGTDFGDVVVFWVGELIGRSEYRKQSDAFHTGMAMLPQKLMRDEALFALSTELCRTQLDTVSDGMNNLIEGFSKLRAHIAVQRRELTAARALSEYHVLKVGHQRLQDSYGITEDILGHLAFVEKERIERGLVAAFFAWLEHGAAVAQETDPLNKLVLQEAYTEMTQAMARDLDWLETQDLAQSTLDLIALQRPQIEGALQ